MGQSTGERLNSKTRVPAPALALGAALVLAMAGCSNEGLGRADDNNVIPTATAPSDRWGTGEPKIFTGVVINGLDENRNKVGVLTYRGPRDGSEAGHFTGGTEIGVDCHTPGRHVEDTHVPKSVGVLVTDEWFRITQALGEAIKPQWIGEPYFGQRTLGEIPQCTPEQIAGS